jgi:hypothetical protein
MTLKHPFWKERAFTFTMQACSAFVVLTAIGMMYFPGGYAFSGNYFSEIGMWYVNSGADANPIGAILFPIALISAGLGLIVYFIGITQLCTQTQLQKIIVWISAAIGLVSGICFIGVAFTPANFENLLGLHSQFVLWAFQLFPLAVIFQMVAIFMDKTYPNKYAFLDLVFALLLFGYVWLITNRPELNGIDERTIQVGGQKVIAYASIFTAYIQSYGARELSKAKAG